MAILGNLIKQIIKFGEQFVELENPEKAQEECLQDLLKQAKDTQFGKDHHFREILESENLGSAFAKAVPYFSYEEMHERYWQKLLDGKGDQSWPGKPDYFALSSGTTGKESKRIPVTDEMLGSIRRAGRMQILALNQLELPDDFFEKEILMLGSSTDLQENKEFLEGEISGISTSTIPFWFRSYYKPGEEIAAIENWDERVQKIAENARNWDIGALSGIPSWIELMLERIIEHHQVEHIHEIWPNLEVYTSGGVAFGPYEKSFRQKLGRPIQVLDTYLASEGYLATQIDPRAEGMRLLVDNGIYFEFVPFIPEHIDQGGKVSPSAKSLTIGEIEDGKEYVLIISTNAGAWRYMIGDTVKVIDKTKAEIVISGRTKFFLNKVGSQLSVQKLDTAIQELEEEFDFAVKEYTLSAQRDEHGEFKHYWYLGTEEKSYSEAELAEGLDKKLQAANKNYKVARSKALKGVELKLLDPSVFHDWSAARKKKGGQVKMEKVMGDERFEEWKQFLEQSS